MLEDDQGMGWVQSELSECSAPQAIQVTTVHRLAPTEVELVGLAGTGGQGQQLFGDHPFPDQGELVLAQASDALESLSGQGSGDIVCTSTKCGETPEEGHAPVPAGVDAPLGQTKQELVGQPWFPVPGLQGRLGHGHQVSGILRLGLHAVKVLASQHNMADTVQ
jgi:hypothetical protein